MAFHLDDDHEILTPEEAADYLRICIRRIYSLASRGVIPGVKIGGAWRFRRQDLDAIFEKKSEKPVHF